MTTLPKKIEKTTLGVIRFIGYALVWFLKEIETWFDGKKMLFTNIISAGLSIVAMYGEYSVLQPHQVFFWTSLLNLLFMAISSGKTLFEWSYPVNSLMFWGNIIALATAIIDMSLEVGMLNQSWALLFATIMIVLRMVNAGPTKQ